jgi:hypothetical protein
MSKSKRALHNANVVAKNAVTPDLTALFAQFLQAQAKGGTPVTSNVASKLVGGTVNFGALTYIPKGISDSGRAKYAIKADNGKRGGVIVNGIEWFISGYAAK